MSKFYVPCFFYKHMKFWIRARLCLAIYDFEVHIMLNFSRNQTTGMRKILTPMWLFKGRLVSLANAYNSIGLIKFKEKIYLIHKSRLGVMLKLSPKIRLINVLLIKKSTYSIMCATLILVHIFYKHNVYAEQQSLIFSEKVSTRSAMNLLNFCSSLIKSAAIMCIRKIY